MQIHALFQTLCFISHNLYCTLHAIVKWGKKKNPNHFIHSEAGKTNCFCNFISSISKVKSQAFRSEVSLWKISLCSCATCLLSCSFSINFSIQQSSAAKIDRSRQKSQVKFYLSSLMKINNQVEEKSAELNHYSFCLAIACRDLHSCTSVGQSIHSACCASQTTVPTYK